MATKSSTPKTSQSQTKPQWYESLKTLPGLRFKESFGDTGTPTKTETEFINIVCDRYEKQNEAVQGDIDRKIVIANRGHDLITLALWVAKNPESMFGSVSESAWDLAMEKLIRLGTFRCVPFCGKEIGNVMSTILNARWVHQEKPYSCKPTTVPELKRFLRSLDRLTDFVRETEFARAYKQNPTIPYKGPSATVVQKTPIAKNPVLRVRWDGVLVGGTPQSPVASGATPKKNDQSAAMEKMRHEVNKLRAENEALHTLLARSQDEKVALQWDLIKATSRGAELMTELRRM
ncbi:hypothetical protein HER10_EVM0001107 [Colletotrichum scovillei]|uniref:Uncharacterized protein n=1 Tax=Colletotrichum scovillei TaxID=1209932 RepID=A0A9P7QYA1_9PEZI|nr:uncharacterized protein HER10_EVM0001107 [Colletotrichum scovillei]KAF4780693.1 hypothetical protein HER10_EVM0001107 [Colletotrichum scovillei]KAG7045605.1 hypothetical protein JMJ77_0009683 [Colletotrichum scovillei]KAG7052765.1 hypothetical protein JMJ78_0005776 [Colletotrichum scovillei]KAG7065058.1 hypothetical protein JMJ76_0012810 [Colletotrichum scovillei]